jgi:hypothetical protein
MSDSEKLAPVFSIGGSQIYRHGDESPWTAPAGEESIEEISGHIEEHLGPVATVFHEIVSDAVHIDVHFVPATEEFPFLRLVTSGMSDLPMSTPPEADVPQFAELLITLPRDWKLDQESIQDENWYWPIRLLKSLARLPHKHQTWLGFGHTVPNGDPPQQYADKVKFTGAIILPPLGTPDSFSVLELPSGKAVHFYSIVPLHEDEMEFKLRAGTNALLDKLDKRNVSDRVDLTRKSVLTKRFGLW